MNRFVSFDLHDCLAAASDMPSFSIRNFLIFIRLTKGRPKSSPESGVIAFSLSWPWVSDFGFVAGYAIGAAALYYHLLGVEPARPRLMRGVALAAFVLGTGLTLWNQQQRNERLGADLYLSSFQPPALILARPVPAERFLVDIERVTAAQARA